jgi:LacI family transcriptional regulator
MKKTTLKQVADKMGVSLSTVSKALMDSHEIGTETKKKVREMAEKMGYRANPYAGHLHNRKSHTIGMIVPEITDNFFNKAISGAESVATERGYHLLIYVTHENPVVERDILNHLQNGRVDGVIMSLTSQTQRFDHIQDLIRFNIPVILFDRVSHEIETAKIVTDDFQSGFNATEHLIQSGCRDIAFLSISDCLSIDSRRKNGYLEAIAKHQPLTRKPRIVQCGTDERSNHEKIRKLLTGRSRPDGIFSSVERFALTTYNVCREVGVHIPEDVKVICFSNLQTANLLQPSLTTITQPAFDMGKQAAEILLKHLSRKTDFLMNQNIMIKSQLIVRNSTMAG